MNAVKKEDTFMTSEEMLDRSSSWTLACDNALLNRLKKFSEDLTKSSQDVLKECDNLSRNITQLDYRLINVSNEFLMLSNTQFVENRVEEFEEFSSSLSSNAATAIPKTKSEKEAALISKMKQAIQLGLAACNERRHRDEMPVNRFKMKQPYIIGSPKFFSSKYCGLVDESIRRVPTYEEDPIDMDSVSIGQSSQIYNPSTVVQGKPEVKFTMPPTPIFPDKVLDTSNENGARDNHLIENGERLNYGRSVIPPSPTISDRSSEVGGRPASNISRDNAMPRSVTDELNKIYGSFAPPPTADDDSDDDFRPSAAVGRIFEDDDDDIFGEKELFPSSQKKTDFFARSNPSPLSAPAFSVPPPMNPLPQSKTAVNDVRTLVGPKPKTNDIPNTNSTTRDIPQNDVLIRGPPPEAEGPSRIKLPPGAVSMFGSLAPPVFNNGNLQAAPIAAKDIISPETKPDKQITSHSSVLVGSGLTPTLSRDSAVGSSHQDGNAQQKSETSQHSHNHNVTVPGRTENVSQGSFSGFGDVISKAKSTQSVPVSSLFADDSSDEDIFLSSKKHDATNTKKVIQSKSNPTITTLPKSSAPTVLSTVASSAKSKAVEKVRVKKSIFDDSESEDDIFSSRPSFSRSENKAATVHNDPFKHDAKKTAAPPKVNNNKSLFGDDSDSDTDLFGNKKKVEVKSSSALAFSSKVSRKMENVKADTVWDQDDLFKDNVLQQVREQTPVKSSENNNNEDHDEHIVNEKPVIQSSSSDSIIAKADIAQTQEELKPKETKNTIKKSIFDDSESDDDLFSSKPSSSVAVPSSSSTTQKQSNSASTKDKGKRSSLFEDDSDSDSDLFGSKTKKNEIEQGPSTEKGDVNEKEISRSNISDKIENEDATNHNKGNQQTSDEVDTTVPKEENEVLNICNENRNDDEAKSTKVKGSKISEKIKAMQTIKSESAETSTDVNPKKNIKSKISVKNLALNLNINPLALKVGAKPPKSSGSTPSTPEKEKSDNSTTNDASLNNLSVLKSSEEKTGAEEVVENKSVKVESKEEKCHSKSEKGEDNQKSVATLVEKPVRVDELVGILKARVKIQKKRRPPSRNFLKSLAVSDEKDGKTEMDITSEENESDNNVKEKEGDDMSSQNKKEYENDEVEVAESE